MAPTESIKPSYEEGNDRNRNHGHDHNHDHGHGHNHDHGHDHGHDHDDEAKNDAIENRHTEPGDSGDDEMNLKLLPPKERRAKWWRYYMRYDAEHHPDKQDYARCNLCGKDLSVREGTTSAIKSHLRRIHVEQYEVLLDTEEDKKKTSKNDSKKADGSGFDGGDYLKLVDPPESSLEDPSNQYSKCWQYYKLYDLEVHPKKQGVARCKKCDGDINYNQEVYKLYRHLANRHPSVYKELYNGEDTTTATMLKETKSKQLKRKKATNDTEDNDFIPLKKIANYPNEGDDNEMTQEEKRAEEKHWLEMWEDARCKMKQIREDIKVESDDEMIEDLKTDMKGLRKRKAHFAQLLGM